MLLFKIRIYFKFFFYGLISKLLSVEVKKVSFLLNDCENLSDCVERLNDKFSHCLQYSVSEE